MNEKTIPILKRGPGFEEPSGTSSLKIVKSLPPPYPPTQKKTQESICYLGKKLIMTIISMF